MRRLKVAMVALGVALFTAGTASGLALAAPSLALEEWMGAAIGVVAGLSLAAGIIWGAMVRPGPPRLTESVRFQPLGSRLAKGEAGPDGRSQALTARGAVAVTDWDRRLHLPEATLSYLRAAGEALEGGRSGAWEVHYFSQSARKLLRLQVARDQANPAAYRVTAELEDIGRWLEPMAPDKQAAAWEGTLLRNLEVPQDYADSPTVAQTLLAGLPGVTAGAPPPRIRSMTVGVARPTLERAPTALWIVELEEGRLRSRCFCEIRSGQLQRSEQLS